MENVIRVLTRTQVLSALIWWAERWKPTASGSIRRCLQTLVTVIAIPRTALSLEQLPRAPSRVCKKAQPRLKMVSDGVLA